MDDGGVIELKKRSFVFAMGMEKRDRDDRL
ncbi:hypothetical protein A2U01_0066459, partial [Trifolium medium]|nr:hypothetical protein [Trifolium medium]